MTSPKTNFDKLINENHSRFLSFIRSIVESKEAAEDILQSAYQRGFEKAKIAGTATPPPNAENDALIAQLKTQSASNQTQIDQLKEELAKTKIAGIASPATNKEKPSTVSVVVFHVVFHLFSDFPVDDGKSKTITRLCGRNS